MDKQALEGSSGAARWRARVRRASAPLRSLLCVSQTPARTCVPYDDVLEQVAVYVVKGGRGEPGGGLAQRTWAPLRCLALARPTHA